MAPRYSPELTSLLRRYYIYQATLSFQLWSPFWVLWLYAGVGDFFQATLVDISFWLSSLLFTMPAGAIADKFGRKPCLIFGTASWSLGIVLFGLASSFPLFVLANVIWALGADFTWGPQSAYLYDSLAVVSKQEEYPRVVSRATLIGFLSNGLGSALGGIAVVTFKSFSVPLLLASVPGVLSLLLVLTFKEPHLPKEKELSMRAQLRLGLNTARTNTQILLVIIFIVLIGIATYVMAFFRQNLLEVLTEADYVLMGLSYAGFFCIAAIAGLSTNRLLQCLGEFGSLFFTFLLVYPSLFIVYALSVEGLFPAGLKLGLGVLTQATFYVIWGFEMPVISTIINRRVLSRERATVFGVSSFFQTLALAIFEPVVGLLAQRYDITFGIFVMATITVVPALIVLLTFRRSAKSGEAAATQVPASTTLRMK